MRFHRSMALLLIACLCTSLRAGESTNTNTPFLVEPLTRGRAAAILANTDELAQAIDSRINTPLGPYEPRPVARPGAPAIPAAVEQVELSRQRSIIDDVRGVLASPWEWRWYARDGRILVAVPTRERVGTLAKARAETLLADMVQRELLDARLAHPEVQVVFIEPESPIRGCSDGGWGTGGWGGAAGAGGWGGGSIAGCACR